MNASIRIHSNALQNVIQVAIYHCYSKHNGEKVFKHLYIDHEHPFNEKNHWNEFKIDSLFDHPLAYHLGHLALGYRHRKDIVRDTVPPLKPHLHMFLKHKPKVRLLNLCTKDNPNCCLQPVELNFKEEEGWDFIRKPERLTVYICNGLCSQTPSTNMSDTKKLFENFLNGTRLPLGQICCLPTGYRPIYLQTKTRHPDVYRTVVAHSVSASSCACNG